MGSSEVKWLSGGNTHDAIAKIGSTVRRPTGTWTPGIHALLRHLEAAGFEHAPRVLGFDDEDREIVTFIEGTIVWPDAPDLLSTAVALTEVAWVIRAFHDAARDFVPPPCEWSDFAADPSGIEEIVCHNDLGPWNLVRSMDSWVFIDWDLAAPGRVAWDLGWAILSLVPFFPDRMPPPDELRRRLEVFCSAYGLDRIPRDVIHVAFERAAFEANMIRTRGERGLEPHARLLREGHYDVWQATATTIAAHEQAWTQMVGDLIDQRREL